MTIDNFLKRLATIDPDRVTDVEELAVDWTVVQTIDRATVDTGWPLEIDKRLLGGALYLAGKYYVKADEMRSELVALRLQNGKLKKALERAEVNDDE